MYDLVRNPDCFGGFFHAKAQIRETCEPYHEKTYFKHVQNHNNVGHYMSHIMRNSDFSIMQKQRCRSAVGPGQKPRRLFSSCCDSYRTNDLAREEWLHQNMAENSDWDKQKTVSL